MKKKKCELKIFDTNLEKIRMDNVVAGKYYIYYKIVF